MWNKRKGEEEAVALKAGGREGRNQNLDLGVTVACLVWFARAVLAGC